MLNTVLQNMAKDGTASPKVDLTRNSADSQVDVLLQHVNVFNVKHKTFHKNIF